jgi:hypothetical protein
MHLGNYRTIYTILPSYSMSRITYVYIYFAPSKLQIFFSFGNNPFLNILGGIDIRGEYSQT